MSNSLQNQLKKMGLVTDAQANKVKKEQGKKSRQKRNSKTAVVEESKRIAKEALAKNAERDRQLNLKKTAESEKKAIAAQIRQLIEINRISIEDGEEPYNFTDGDKVKKIYVTGIIKENIVKGRLSIVKFGDGYEVIPSPVAEKIICRDSESVIVSNSRQETSDIDDEYSEYKIPDDLMW